MSADSDRSESQPAASADCPLTAREQTRNLILYGTNVSLIYLGAPVLYVGLTQAALCEQLGASKTIANLPSTLYFWMTPLPILVAWYFCAVRRLKPVLVMTYLTVAFVGAVVTGALLVPTPEAIRNLLVTGTAWLEPDLRPPPDWVIPAMLLHAGVLGWALGVVATYQWEMLGRGVTESRRGQALALAFGAGPILAFLVSLGSQQVLTGVAYPVNFALLFASSVPLMATAAFLSTRFVVLYPPVEIPRPPLVAGVFGGLGQFLSYRVLLLAAVAAMLVSSGYNILPNISLYTQEAIGSAAVDYVGYQNALRFGCKAGAGFFLGWLLTKTNPRAGMLATAAFCLVSVLWALLVPGKWFLLSFAWMGAGELFGVYFPNYILCSSAKSKMRRNMAFNSMFNMPCGFTAIGFGYIADRVGAIQGEKFGFQVSFVASILILLAVIVLVLVALPARPRPREIDKDDSDRALEKASQKVAV